MTEHDVFSSFYQGRAATLSEIAMQQQRALPATVGDLEDAVARILLALKKDRA